MKIHFFHKNIIHTIGCRIHDTTLFATLLLTLSATSPSYAEGAAVTDAIGREITIHSSERIITLGPDVSEIAFGLGVGDRIVALDRSSRFPPETASKPNLGYRRSLSIEGILSLDPDLILAAEDIGPPDTVDILKELSIPVVFLPEDNSAAGVERKIDIIAAALNLESEGRKMKVTVAEAFEEITGAADQVPSESRKKVVFLHGLLRLTAAGRNTPAHEIITLAGGKNPFDQIDGYKTASEELLLKMKPDTILMLPDGKGGPTPEEVFAIPALQLTPAGRNRSLVVLEGPYMLGFGPRTALAIQQLAEALYPLAQTAGSHTKQEDTNLVR